MIPVKVLVVDDHALFRRGLAEVLDEEPDPRAGPLALAADP